jgi:chromosome partitioning protein
MCHKRNNRTCYILALKIPESVYDIGSDRYRVLLTKVPPPPEPDGPQLRAALSAQGVPLFAADIPRLKAFEKAAAAGVPISEVDDRRAERGWEAYKAAGKELASHV